MKSIVNGVRIAGIEAAVPTQRVRYLDTVSEEARRDAEKACALTGVYEQRIAPWPLTTADLCIAAAETLLKKLDWAPETVDAIVFVTQGGDYPLPATACLMQHRLGLPTSAAAFDVNLGCSGYTYGIWLVGQLLAGSASGRALLLVGDISSRTIYGGDRSTGPLFGDAGSATALERSPDATPIYAVTGTDGKGGKHISITGGGARSPFLPALRREPDENEAMFKSGHLHLEGPEVFSFTLRAVPKLLGDILAHAGNTLDDIDMCVMHQANQFILEHLRKKTKVPADKFLVDMRDFGNTSSASIPLAICHSMGGALAERRHRLLLAGFGVGWSWAAIIADIGPIPRPGLTEIDETFPVLQFS